MEKDATAVLREPTRVITTTKGHYTGCQEGQFEDYNESEEDAVLLLG